MDADNCLTVGAPRAGPFNCFETPSGRLHAPVSSRRSERQRASVGIRSRGIVTSARLGGRFLIPTGPAGLRDDSVGLRACGMTVWACGPAG
jgi:hypothetical protein